MKVPFVLLAAINVAHGQDADAADSGLVPILTGNVNHYRFPDSIILNYKGGSISHAFARAASQYGLPSNVYNAILDLDDVALATVFANWATSVDDDMKSTFTAQFYFDEVFGQLLPLEIIDEAKTYLDTVAGTYIDAGNTLGDLMTTVVDGHFQNVRLAAIDFLANQNGATQLDTVNAIDGFVNAYAAIGLSRNVAQQVVVAIQYVLSYLYAYESIVSESEYAVYAYETAQSLIFEATLGNIGDQLCMENMGLFGFLRQLTIAIHRSWGLFIGVLQNDKESVMKVSDSLLGPGIDGSDPIAYDLVGFMTQFGISGWLEETEHTLHLLELLVDPSTKSLLYSAISGPICGN